MIASLFMTVPFSLVYYCFTYVIHNYEGIFRWKVTATTKNEYSALNLSVKHWVLAEKHSLWPVNDVQHLISKLTF